MAVTSTIVTVTAEVTPASAPSTLQRSGALVSVGGTTLTAGTYQFCSNLAAVTAILSSSGNFTELSHMATTFFAQQNVAGSSQGVYVLELGASGGVVTTQITSLQTWINTNPNIFYAYLLPATWDGSGAALNTMAANYSSPTSRTYFFVTSTTSTYTAYAVTTKSIWVFVPSPTAAGTEFGAAALFYQWLINNPNAATPMAPMAYRFLYGVTPWDLNGNQTEINTLLSAFVNIILTGAEGGISTACLFKGTTIDGNQGSFWYAVDWLLIQAKQTLAADTINGSNSNPPLYYNQNGINQLLSDLEQLGTDGVAFGLFQTCTFEAVPFKTYVTENPNDYAAGNYAGFSATETWQGGFLTITFNLDATQFVS